MKHQTKVRANRKCDSILNSNVCPETNSGSLRAPFDLRFIKEVFFSCYVTERSLAYQPTVECDMMKCTHVHFEQGHSLEQITI